MNYHGFDIPDLRGKQTQTDRHTHTHNRQFQTLYDVFVVMVIHIQSNYILIKKL